MQRWKLVIFREHAAQHLLKERAVGAAHGAGADLLVIGTDEHAGLFRRGIQQRLQAGEA